MYVSASAKPYGVRARGAPVRNLVVLLGVICLSGCGDSEPSQQAASPVAASDATSPATSLAPPRQVVAAPAVVTPSAPPEASPIDKVLRALMADDERALAAAKREAEQEKNALERVVERASAQLGEAKQALALAATRLARATEKFEGTALNHRTAGERIAALRVELKALTGDDVAQEREALVAQIETLDAEHSGSLTCALEADEAAVESAQAQVEQLTVIKEDSAVTLEVAHTDLAELKETVSIATSDLHEERAALEDLVKDNFSAAEIAELLVLAERSDAVIPDVDASDLAEIVVQDAPEARLVALRKLFGVNG